MNVPDMREVVGWAVYLFVRIGAVVIAYGLAKFMVVLLGGSHGYSRRRKAMALGVCVIGAVVAAGLISFLRGGSVDVPQFGKTLAALLVPAVIGAFRGFRSHELLTHVEDSGGSFD